MIREFLKGEFLIMRFLFLSVFTFFALNSATLKAAEFASCYGCSSLSSFESLAQQTASESLFHRSKVYVFNMAQPQIRAYDTDLEIMPDGRVFATVVEQAVDTDTQSKFDSLADAYSAVATETENPKYIPSNIAPSAYRLVNASYVVNNVIDYYNSQSFRTKTANYVAAALALAGKLIDIDLTLTVTFSDGSEAVFKFTGVNSNGELGFELISAKDVDNNNIPLTKEGYESGGEYSFLQGGQNAIEEFLNAAARAGVIIVRGGNDSNSTEMVCDNEGRCVITIRR